MTTDEKGQPITSPVVEMGVCIWCRTAINVHAKGRRPKFCGPRCRNRHHRATKRVDRAYQELIEAGEALERGEPAAHHPTLPNPTREEDR